MATHIIIDARNKVVLASTEAPGKGTVFFAVDLISDTWGDFSHFLDAAVQHEKAGEFALRNRHLRAAMMNLFAHLDGVVSGVCDQFVQQGHLDARYAGDSQDKCSLKSKIVGLRGHFKKKNQQLPYIKLDLKPIRDIISHPSVAKTKSGDNSVILTHVDVYGVDIREVVDAGKQIDQWLNRVCRLAKYQRFVDTKAEIEKLVASLEAEGIPVQLGEVNKF
jgi:hypothetical protein